MNLWLIFPLGEELSFTVMILNSKWVLLFYVLCNFSSDLNKQNFQKVGKEQEAHEILIKRGALTFFLGIHFFFLIVIRITENVTTEIFPTICETRTHFTQP